MVNTGRPSRACATCKKRRIKCDQSTPACLRCQKSGWKCPGYSSQPDNVFRNQTVTPLAGQNARREEATTSGSSALQRNISPPDRDRATNFFIQQYVYIIESNHEYLPGLLRSQQSSFGLLGTTVAAAGFAALSNAGNAPDWRAEAFRLHSDALRQLRAALQDPVERLSDQTLGAVMLMGTFETIASADISSMKSFGHHIIAAAHCFEMRGPDQFRSVEAVKLFMHMRRNIITTCHQLQEPVPHQLSRWSRWAERFQDADLTPVNQFSDINEHLACVRAEFKYKSITDPAIIASQLLPIDKMFQDWAQALPESWAYRSYCSNGSKGLPSCRYSMQQDVYSSPWTACIWNCYRNVRILIHESIIAATLRHGTEEQKTSLKSSYRVLAAEADDICHSASYLLGRLSPRTTNDDSGMTLYPESSPSPGGFLLLWPLFFSGTLRTSSIEQRKWVAEVVRRIGIQMGSRLAMSLAKLLEEKPVSFSHNDTIILGEWHPN